MFTREFIGGVVLPLFGTIAFGLLSPPLINDLPKDEQVLQGPYERMQYGPHAYVARVSFPLAKVDVAREQGGGPVSVATVVLFEDGQPLGPAHASFQEIASVGHGRFIFGRDTQSMFVIFSTSDNSDPNGNGRTYRIKDEDWHDIY
jgi:hypothetical protein